MPASYPQRPLSATGKMEKDMSFTQKALCYPLPLLLAACATMPGSPQTQSATAIGQTMMIGDIGVTPLNVIEDSRCPTGVQCVSAGRVIVKTQLTSPTGDAVYDITLGQPVSFAGGGITLTDVAPTLVEGRFPAQSDYRLSYAYTPGDYNSGYSGY